MLQTKTKTRRTRSKRKRLWQAAMAAAFLAAFILVISHDRLEAKSPKNGGEPPPALVKVSPVLKKKVVTRITLVGTAEPRSETVVASEEAGLVRKMLVDEGDQVKMNQTLCIQDATQLTLTMEASRATLGEAEVMQARAQREWERQKRLFAINSVSKKAYEDAQFDVGAARKKVARLQAEFYTLLDQVKKKTIYAPVSGYVVER
ncbi:MAG: hypothetical protein HQ561_14765, partial [Desulfobacteraceae bacterium]|nr:hypothetical protein [Desulfobacteraceae bacterium]